MPGPYDECNSGYVCINGSKLANPLDDDGNDICPAGYFCPRGTSNPIPCSPGTFRNTTGGQSPLDCFPCLEQFYCQDHSLTAPNGICQEGYFCPPGQNSSTPIEFKCEAGMFCTKGAMHPCPSGMYQDEVGQSDCKLCPSGYFCNATISPITSYEDSICPPGFICPNGTEYDSQYPCPIGTYNPLIGQSLRSGCLACRGGFACDSAGIDVPKQPCAAGYYCASNSLSPTPRDDGTGNYGVCPKGHFCTKQTSVPSKCPIGTFNRNKGAKESNQCLNCTAGYFCSIRGLIEPVTVCPAGYFCPVGTTEGQENVCPAGAYCPEKSSQPHLCPPGTYSENVGLNSSSSCSPCPLGKYCDSYGLTEPKGNCSSGYYCPTGSNSSTAVVCPAGKFCPEGVGFPLNCADGTYSDVQGNAACKMCPAGYYCVHDDGQNNSSIIIRLCPSGFYCKNGTGLDWIACPPGSYSDNEGLSAMDQCKPCEPGMYCNGYNLTLPSGECDPGYFCVSGSIVKNPSNDSACHDNYLFPIRGDICPVGHFCKKGSKIPQICHAGSYQDTTGQSECKSCIRGYFCKEGTIQSDEFPCPTGHFCPPQSKLPSPCPPGTFNNRTKATDERSCLPCPGGLFCQGYGLDEPSGECLAGWYCLGGAKTATPMGGAGGDICPPGYFCPSTTINPLICPAGFFCRDQNLAKPNGKCSSGFYCEAGSTSKEQFKCETGHYCVDGSQYPCPPGTLGDAKGLSSENECAPCPPGFYCAISGLTNSTGPCNEGYYCPGGQTEPNSVSLTCPAGFMCPVSSSQPIPCDNGYFQNVEGQAVCKLCPPRYYCENTNGSGIIWAKDFPCVTGHFCPEGTNHRYQHKCPSSTFSNLTMLMDSSECQRCPPKYYCANEGLTEPEGLCLPGYFCNGSSSSSMQHICPENMYCPAGTEWPLPCPDGTISKGKIGNKDVTQCEQCPRGFYCRNMQQHLCLAGYICISGSSTPTPVNGIHGYQCPKGHYCPEGSLNEIPCTKGSYMPFMGQSKCLLCPVGSRCPFEQMNQTLPCNVGHYCNETGLLEGHGCPIGTYYENVSAEDVSFCKPCKPGYFCADTGLDTPRDKCKAGYLCLSGAKNPTPNGSESENSPCPRGKFCVEGTTAAEDCPVGTINGNLGLQSKNECQPCPAGFYCNETGAITPSGPCNAGYFCPSNEIINDPRPTNFQCPSGHICPSETADPVGCPPGTFQPNEQFAENSCFGCPPGYFCIGNTSIPSPCPAHSYCPANSSHGMMCPNGTYTENDASKLESSDDCTMCKTGYYCVNGQLTAPCSAGYWCISGSDTPTPSGDNEVVGKPCPFGFFCPEGTLIPKKCKNGTFIGIVGATSENDCGRCPPGTLCPDDAKEPTPCAPGE